MPPMIPLLATRSPRRVRPSARTRWPSLRLVESAEFGAHSKILPRSLRQLYLCWDPVLPVSRKLRGPTTEHNLDVFVALHAVMNCYHHPPFFHSMPLVGIPASGVDGNHATTHLLRSRRKIRLKLFSSIELTMSSKNPFLELSEQDRG